MCLKSRVNPELSHGNFVSVNTNALEATDVGVLYLIPDEEVILCQLVSDLYLAPPRRGWERGLGGEGASPMLADLISIAKHCDRDRQETVSRVAGMKASSQAGGKMVLTGSPN